LKKRNAHRLLFLIPELVLRHEIFLYLKLQRELLTAGVKKIVQFGLKYDMIILMFKVSAFWRTPGGVTPYADFHAGGVWNAAGI